QDARLIRDFEERLQALNLPEEEQQKRRKAFFKIYELEPSGFTSSDIDLPEGAILMGVFDGVLYQAIARGAQLWVEDVPFQAISTAAAHITGNRTKSGWEFFKMAYIPRKG